MSKIIYPLALFLSLFFIYPQIYGDVKAAVEITITPPQLTSQNSSGLDINIRNLINDRLYFVRAQKTGSTEQLVVLPGADGRNRSRPDSSGTISFHLCASGSSGNDMFRVTNNCNGKTFPEGVYSIKVYESDNNIPSNNILIKTTSFSVSAETGAEINFMNTGFTTTDDIVIRASGGGLNGGSYKILVDGKDTNSKISCININNGDTINLGKYYEGPHNIQIYTNESGTIRHPLCGQGSLVTYRSFTVNNQPIPGPAPVGPGPAVVPGTTSPAGTVTIKQCKSKDDPTFNKNTDAVCALAGGEPCDNKTGIKTAIGCIHTNPAGFAKDVLKFAIGIGGGLAFLMMLLGAFQMLTSAGNPDSLKAGQDRLTSAVIGLLFVIFATLFLQIIGFDILKLPGFSR